MAWLAAEAGMDSDGGLVLLELRHSHASVPVRL